MSSRKRQEDEEAGDSFIPGELSSKSALQVECVIFIAGELSVISFTGTMGYIS